MCGIKKAIPFAVLLCHPICFYRHNIPWALPLPLAKIRIKGEAGKINQLTLRVARLFLLKAVSKALYILFA